MEQHPVVISVCGKPGTDATYVEFVEALHKNGFFDRFELAQIRKRPATTVLQSKR